MRHPSGPLGRCHAAFLPVLLLCAVPVLAAANCARSHALSPAQQAQWTRDSLDYENRLAKWKYDSAAVDSVVRSIKTDSLERLYELMFVSNTPIKELQLISCEEDRITRHYGAIPSVEVASHVRDSMYHVAGGSTVARMRSRMPRTGRLSSGACGKGTGPVVKATPGGTRLDVMLNRPLAPKRP